MDASTLLAQAQADLTAINAAITARLSGGAVDSYTIGGRSVQYAKLTELYAMRDKTQQSIGRLSGVCSVEVQFGRPT